MIEHFDGWKFYNPSQVGSVYRPSCIQQFRSGPFLPCQTAISLLGHPMVSFEYSAVLGIAGLLKRIWENMMKRYPIRLWISTGWQINNGAWLTNDFQRAIGGTQTVWYQRQRGPWSARLILFISVNLVVIEWVRIGAKDGQVLVIRDGSSIDAYQVSAVFLLNSLILIVP